MALDEGPRSASVETLETSRFNRLMLRVRALTENIRSLALLDVYGRVARLLLEMATEQDHRLVVAAKLPRQDIAERVGASREMISRIFKDLLVWRLYRHRTTAYRDQSEFTGTAVKLAPL